jgi:signal transduction histidine kinase
MLVLGGALGWLGWRLLKQDRALEKQRLQGRLEMAADGMVTALQQSVADLERYRDFTSEPGVHEPPDGVLALRASKRTVEVFPPNGLLFYPIIPEAEEPPEATFAAGEILEYGRNDPAKAAEVFRKLSRSADPGVRAGALLRLGRNLRKLGRGDEALRAYDDLAKLGRTRVLGLPAELTARGARCTVFETAGRREDLRQEASLMHSGLWSGRWRLLRPAWEFHAEQARRWSGASPLEERQQNALALAAAVESSYRRWLSEPGSQGDRFMRIQDRAVLISWSGTPDRLALTLAGPAYLGSTWTELLRVPGIQGALIDADGQVMIGSYEKSGPRAIRMAPASRLPGTLYVTGAGTGVAEPGYAGRRRLFLSGFAVLTLMILAGSYFIMRSINREQAAARLQSEFVSAVSHEFRTPLTSLRQLSEMLSKGRVPTEDLRQQSYEIMSRESERLQRLVESLLDFSRIEARAFRYHFEPLDPVTLVGDVVAEFREKATAQGYRVELEVAGEFPPVHVDREAFGLALRNLLDNAVKYSPDCRTIWVEMGCERDRLAIRVRDRGLGIPASEHKEIFRRFVRGSGSRAAHVQGTGIGLAMARHIIEAHGGEIRLDSAPGKGSTFTILLPTEKRT